MWKKFIAAVSMMALLITSAPYLTFAAEDGDFINSVNLSGKDIYVNRNEVLNVEVDFDLLNERVQNSTGFVTISDIEENFAHTLYSWGSLAGEEPTAPVENEFFWDGVTGCPDLNCDEGSYKVVVYVFSSFGGGEMADRVERLFNLRRDVAISDFSKSREEINPLSDDVEERSVDFVYGVSKDNEMRVEIRKNGVVVALPVNGEDQVEANNPQTVSWDGRDQNGDVVADGEYVVRIMAKDDGGLFVQVLRSTVNVVSEDNGGGEDNGGENEFRTLKFDVTPSHGGDNLLDASPLGNNERLKVDYDLSENPQSVIFEIRNENGDLLKTTVTNNLKTAVINDIWDGKFANRLVETGVYTVKMLAINGSGDRIDEDKEITVAYGSVNKPQLRNLAVNPSEFNTTSGDATIGFDNLNTVKLRVNIENQDGTVVRDFSEYNGNEYGVRAHNIIWNGKTSNGTTIAQGDYVAVIEAYNDYGVVVERRAVKISNTLSNLVTSNAHLRNISCRPSRTVEPDKDDFLSCDADVDKDNVDVKVYAVRGDKEIEIYSERGMRRGTKEVEFEWDMRDDDDEYVDQGVWRIEFRSTLDGVDLLGGLTREVVYQTPQIDELYVSKKKIDNDRGEFTYVMFKLRDEAAVSLFYLVDGRRDEEIIEDVEVDGKKWYAYQIDGGRLRYNDKIDIELVAASKANESINSSKRVSFDLEEDRVSSGRVNITNDYISPVVTDCRDAELEISFELEDEARVDLSIHRGKTASGSTVATLLDNADLRGGSNSVVWNCKDRNGNQLSNGFYSYKITSRDRSSETEEGMFIVANLADIGDVDGFSGSRGGSSTTGSGGVSTNVTINSGGSAGSDNTNTQEENCAGFIDVSANHPSCEAIKWAKGAGIFEGYPNGTFGLTRSINRVELLKVILEANSIATGTTPAGNLGFRDVLIGEWYMRYVAKAMELNIFNGDDGINTARPGDDVNRVEALKIVFETIRVKSGYNAKNCVPSFADVSGDQWYSKYVCEAELYDLYENISANNFMPAKAATRGEIVEMLYKLEEVGLF